MTASVTRPADFDPKATAWSRGMVAHLAAATEGRTLMVETVGGLLQDYAVVGYRDRFGGHGDIVLKDSLGRSIGFFAPTIGIIIVEREGFTKDAVRDARDSYMAVSNAAVMKVREERGWDETLKVRVTGLNTAHVAAYKRDAESRRERIVWHGEVTV